MNFANLFSQLGRAIVHTAADAQIRKRPAGQKGPECTPCAAQAYVNGLHAKPAKKARRK